MPGWHQILPPMRRVRRRLRAQAALDLAVVVAVPACAGLLVGLYLLKLHLVSPALLGQLGLGAAAAVATGALLGACRPVPLSRAAKALDRAGDLRDRITSAYEFGADPPDAYQRAAVADALAHLPRVTPRAAAPLREPRGLRALGAAALALGLVALVRIPPRAAPPRRPAPTVETLALDPGDLMAERDLARSLEREAARTDDAELEDLARELSRLLDDLEQGNLTRKELFEKLAAMEQKYTAGLEGDFDEILKELRKLGTELSKEKPLAELGKALAQDDVALAKEELDKIAEKLKQPPEKPREDRELAKALERAERALDLQRQDERDRRAREALERQRKRLQRELERQPRREDLRRKLERQRRELERLTRNQQRRAQQRRRLERLTRDLSRAGQQAQSGQRREAADSARQASREMSRFAGELRRGQALRKLQGQLVDLKETLRRAGGRPGDQGKQGLAGRDGKDGKDQGKQGKHGTGKHGDFFTRARGREPRPGDLIVKDESGDLQLFREGENGANGQDPGMAQPGEGQDAPGEQPADGIGDSHDPNLLGDKTRLQARHRNLQAYGKEGAGPTRAETILSAADRGFATRGYRKVYQDYTAVTEEVLARERVPLGFKYYVKRYFRLIMPRE